MINTFVFLDLETTGLISRNCFPKITELSLIAISRESIYKKQKTIPRVLHKLTIPINPDTNIPKIVETMTYLNNNNLSFVKKFENKTVHLIEHFLHNLLCPVCLVAHNGKKFDFPILCHEISSLKMDHPQDSLNIFDTLTVDTIDFFKEYFKNPSSSSTSPTKNMLSTGLSNDFQNLLNDGCDEFILKTPMGLPTTRENECNDKTSSSKGNVKLETSRTKKITKSKTKKTEQNYNDAVGYCIHKKPNDYKLTTLFKHILGDYPKGSHTAEGDCLTLFECINQMGDCFATWADEKAVPLQKYKSS